MFLEQADDFRRLRGDAGVRFHLGTHRMILLRPQRPQVGYQVVCTLPRRLIAVKRARQRRLRRQLPHKHTQSAGRQGAAVEVQQVHSVFAYQIGLYLVAVLIE